MHYNKHKTKDQWYLCMALHAWLTLALPFSCLLQLLAMNWWIHSVYIPCTWRLWEGLRRRISRYRWTVEWENRVMKAWNNGGTRLTRKNIRGCGSFLENLSSIPSLISFCSTRNRCIIQGSYSSWQVKWACTQSFESLIAIIRPRAPCCHHYTVHVYNGPL